MSAETAEGMPRAVSTHDLESVNVLRARLEEMHANDVRVIRGEPVAAMIETAASLSGKVSQRLGGIATEGQLVIGIATVDSAEDSLLKEARRLQSPEQRLYT